MTKRPAASSSRGEALPHFNEVDECAGLDGLVTYRLWRELGYPPENTLHDLRWGRQYQGQRARRLRLGVPHLRRRAARAFHRRLEGRLQRTPAADVFPPRRRHAQGHQQAGLDRLEPRFRRWTANSIATPASAEVVELPQAETERALAANHAAMADHARRARGHHRATR